MHIFKYLAVFYLFFCFVNSQAQETTIQSKKYGFFYEQYYALKNDTSIKHGRYFRKYKGYVIERGVYKNGEKSGRWAYFSLNGIFEFEYDYNVQKVTKIANRQTPDEYFETPVFFDGSPLIPYVYIVNHIDYPQVAKNQEVTGRVTLAVSVDSAGRPVQLQIIKKLHPMLDREVLRVAKTFPRSWNWIPATYNGQNVSNEYHIDIEFELVE